MKPKKGYWRFLSQCNRYTEQVDMGRGGIVALWGAGDAGGELRISDLMDALGADRAKLPGDARKKLERLDKRLQPVAAPLPSTIRARKQRQAGCAHAADSV